MLIQAAERDGGSVKELLQGAAEQLRRTDEHLESLVNLALSEEITVAVNANRDTSVDSIYPSTLKIEIERKKAAFSTWYELFPRSASEHPPGHRRSA